MVPGSLQGVDRRNVFPSAFPVVHEHTVPVEYLMRVHTVKKGLDIPLAGVPEQVITDAPTVTRVAILARDFVGLKARVLVEPGDTVQLGQPLLEHRTYADVKFVSPGAGRVEAVHRGAKRALLSVVVALDTERDSAVTFPSYSAAAGNDAASARALLLESGLWTAFRTRPFSQVPNPQKSPSAIFVTATDTNPLAPDLNVVMHGRDDDIARGLRVLTLLTTGPVYCCRRPGSTIGGANGSIPRVHIEEFDGVHPAGTVGYHIHVLSPVHRNKSVWHIGIQDVARIGRLFATGTLDVTQIVAFGGPVAKHPRLLRTRLGASVVELVSGEVQLDNAHTAARYVSGSVLVGDRAGDETQGFLGRFHQQISVLAEGGTREFLGWIAPGAKAFSVLPAFLSSLLPARPFALDTSMRGSRRAMVPIGAYERVMPMDLMPTHLLRALTVGDLGWAEELGVLELDEEDLALCTFVCPGKYEHGAALRRTLTALAAEQ